MRAENGGVAGWKTKNPASFSESRVRDELGFLGKPRQSGYLSALLMGMGLNLAAVLAGSTDETAAEFVFIPRRTGMA